MSENPNISVIIPIYNSDKYLSECIDSVLMQSLKNIEIICINDGSTDNTKIILEEYLKKDKRIQVINQENEGVSVARNKGIKKAKGEFLFFLDSDDYLPDEKVFEDLYLKAKENDILICGGGFSALINGIVEDEFEGSARKYRFEQEGVVSFRDYQYDYGWVRFIYNRRFVLESGIEMPSLKFFEDPVWFAQIMHKAGKFYALKRTSYCYRIGHKSTWLSYERTRDAVKGVYINIAFAKKHSYDDLISLEIERLENDFAGFIASYLENEESSELREILSQINKIIFTDNNRIEYKIYRKIIRDRDNEKRRIIKDKDNEKKRTIKDKDNEIIRAKEEFYNSTTWKIGNAILFVPKKLKNILKR